MLGRHESGNWDKVAGTGGSIRTVGVKAKRTAMCYPSGSRSPPIHRLERIS